MLTPNILSTTPVVKWFDSYEYNKERICFTSEQLSIPGLRVFASLKPLKAISPLVLHYHENAFEFTFVSRGTMSFYTNEEDYIANHGNIFVSFPNEAHSTNHIPLTPMHIYWMQIDISNPSSFFFLDELHANQIIGKLFSINKHLISVNDKEMDHIIRAAFNLCLNNGNNIIISQYILIFLEMLTEYAQKIHDNHNDQIIIKHAVAYINEHLCEEISLEMLAEQCSLSTSQFKQKFSNTIGTPPRNYINLKKIEYSKQLLSTGVPITQVAMDLGFSTSSYFATVFKKFTTLSPSEFIFQSHD